MQRIKFICETVDQQKTALQAGMRDRSIVLALSSRFHEKSEDVRLVWKSYSNLLYYNNSFQFALKTKDWMQSCDIKASLPVDSEALTTLIKSHKELTGTITQSFADVSVLDDEFGTFC